MTSKTTNSKHNIMFSQVREDPSIEIHALQSIPISNDRKYVLLVGSGGCTLLSLLAFYSHPLLIDIVDSNLDQLLLIELKKAICKYLNSYQKIIQFLQGELSVNEYDNIINTILPSLSPNCQKYWCTKMDLIYSGINQCGTFEQLFVELVDSNWNFDKVFNRTYLISKFGENAVTNSMSTEFSDHFSNIMSKYLTQYTLDNNYFYQQILHGTYNPIGDLPYYLSHFDNFKSHIDDGTHKTQTFLSDLTSFKIRPGHYDLIQTSNLTDWMPAHQLDSFMQEVATGLKPGGKVVARRLNGDYDLAKIMSKYLNVEDVTKFDKSCFYSQVIIGTLI